MNGNERRYEGRDIVVSYDVRRCIHEEECVDGLPGVFDRDRRPWVDADGASADRVAEVVMRCPTGALQFERRDSGSEEPAPSANTIEVSADGPLYLRGAVRIVNESGALKVSETRVALCRCGASENKPFCDGRHSDIAFHHPGTLGKEAPRPEGTEKSGELEVKPAQNGPLLLQGSLEIRSADGGSRFFGEKAALCRCGASDNKPFCDGSHKEIGFVSDR